MREKAIYVALILIIFTSGLLMIFKVGYDPAPERVMKPSFFTNPEEIGAVTYRRFYYPIQEVKMVAFGVPPQPEFHRAIVTGFLKAAAAEKQPFDALISEAQMPPLDLTGVPPMEIYSLNTNTQTQSELIERYEDLKKRGKRTLLYTASIFSTHVLEKNPINRFEKQTGEKLFAITSGPLALAANQEHLIDPPCIGSERDVNGTAGLGCMLLKGGRQYYRKKVPQIRYVAIMIAPKPGDYLLQISEPGQDERSAAHQKTKYTLPPDLKSGEKSGQEPGPENSPAPGSESGQ